jgi:transcriptional regulator of arginine metabolism
MTKHARHDAIRDLVQTRRVASQEQLRELLETRGFEVTQATLSRDIRELRLSKAHDSEGAHYTLPSEAWEHSPTLSRLLPALFIGAEGTANLLIVKTMLGGAQAVAEAIDAEEWPEVLGTLAGDNTVLVILRDAGQLPVVQGRLEDRAGPPQ